jgi:hypothetical protein
MTWVVPSNEGNYWHKKMVAHKFVNISNVLDV